MAIRPKRHPLYVCFLVLMLLMAAAGVLLLVAGGMNHGSPALRLPWIRPRVAWGPWHG